MATIDELKALALQIRDADEDRENTALKVGQFLYDLLGYLDTKADLSMRGQWSKQLSLNQTPIVALQSVEAIPDSQGQNNKMWWSSDDGQLKWKSNDEVYPLGIPTYILYYCGKKIYKWSGSTPGFVDMTHAVINDLTTGGEGDALSAEMGRTLMVAIQQILGALGNYAFPGGKPTIDWGGSSSDTYTVTYPTDSKVTHTGAGDTVELGGSLEVTLGIASGNDLYVIDDDSVKVYMGSNEIAGAYNPSTGKVTIANVVGNVVIVANAITYVQDDLVLHLDCKNLGGTSGHWKSLVNYNGSPIDFTLGSSVSASDSGVVFDGTLNSYGETDASLDVAHNNGTIEGVFNGASNQYNPILVNPTNYKIGLLILTSTVSNNRVASICMYQSGTTPTGLGQNVAIETGNNVSDFALSQNIERYMNKGVPGTPDTLFSFVMTKAHTKLTVGCARRPDHSNDIKFVGTIKAIRVYSRKLSTLEQTQNWKVDKKRFNIS